MISTVNNTKHLLLIRLPAIYIFEKIYNSILSVCFSCGALSRYCSILWEFNCKMSGTETGVNYFSENSKIQLLYYSYVSTKNTLLIDLKCMNDANIVDCITAKYK